MASNAGMLCSVSQAVQLATQCFIKRCGRSHSISTAVTQSLPVIFKTWLEEHLKCLSFGMARGYFPVNGMLRSLDWKSLIVERTVFFTGSFVFHRQLELRLELLRFWGLSSAVSTQSFRRPALTRINAIFTFITNQHSNAERRTRVCMNDKLLNWTYLLWIEGYPADISIMVVWVFTLVLRYYSNGQPSHSWVCCLLFTSSLSQGELTVIRRWVMIQGSEGILLLCCWFRINSHLNHRGSYIFQR